MHLTGYFVGPEMKAEYFEREVGTGRPVSAGCTASINLLMRKMDGTVIEDTRSGNKGEPVCCCFLSFDGSCTPLPHQLDLDLSAPTTTGIMQGTFLFSTRTPHIRTNHPALRDGLLGMKQGGARKIVVPPNLAKFEHDGVPVSVEGLLPDDVVILGMSISIFPIRLLTSDKRSKSLRSYNCYRRKYRMLSNVSVFTKVTCAG